MVNLLPWVLFNLFVIAMMAIDLGIFHRRSHTVGVKESLKWTGVWIALALAFCAGVYWFRGSQKALEFLTAYLIEESLSIDNLFVFLVIFNYFCVPHEYQHKILFWGIIGVLVLRAAFVLVGIALIHHFHWMIYVFGGFLIFTAIRLAMEKDKKMECNNNPVVKFFKRWMPVTDRFEGDKFFVRKDSRWFATPMMIVLLAVETTDVLFAVDSIPAVFAVSIDPFIVYTSNVFAVLGLRALFFALSGLMRKFHHLHYGLAFILLFVGVKMLISGFFKIPIAIALLVIVSTLMVSVFLSLMFPPSERAGSS